MCRQAGKSLERQTGRQVGQERNRKGRHRQRREALTNLERQTDRQAGRNM